MILLANVLEKPPAQGELFLVLLAVPRLHDLGRSGWWITLPIAAEVVAFVMLARSDASIETIEIAGGIVVILLLIGAIALGLIPGQRDANPWGDPPPQGVNWRVRR